MKKKIAYLDGLLAFTCLAVFQVVCFWGFVSVCFYGCVKEGVRKVFQLFLLIKIGLDVLLGGKGGE